MSDTHIRASVHYNQFTHPTGACLEITWVRAVTTIEGPNIMPEDSEFEKKDFDRVITNLLHSPPLRKKDLGTSRTKKVKTVLLDPHQHRQPKRGREDAD
jgi:hypothetical protein